MFPPTPCCSVIFRSARQNYCVTNLDPEEPRVARRLEGWPQARSVRPSFETAASRPPHKKVLVLMVRSPPSRSEGGRLEPWPHVRSVLPSFETPAQASRL